MLNRVRDVIASGLSVVAQRLSRDPRYVQRDRVPALTRTLAGVAITPDTATTIPAVAACVRYLQDSVAMLPWDVMRRGRGGTEVQERHAVQWLLHDEANPECSSYQFRETLLHWALLWGNGYAEIERDSSGKPFALWPIPPWRVNVCREAETGDLVYEVDNGDGGGGKVDIARTDMFHLRGFGHGPVGISIVTYAGQMLGWSRAAQLFGASFFGNGMQPAGVVINKKPLKEAGLRAQKAEFEQLYKGPRNANKTAFLDNDADWKPIGFNAREAQLIDVHQHLVEETCRLFAVPPHKIGHLLNAHFQNIEHQNNDAVISGVLPWARRFEIEANRTLFGRVRNHGYFTKMNIRALLRGDFKSQNEGLEIARRNAVINADEWREQLDMNAIGEKDGGKKYIMQAHNTTLEKIGEEPEPVDDVTPPEPANDDEEDEAVAALLAMERERIPVHAE